MDITLYLEYRNTQRLMNRYRPAYARDEPGGRKALADAALEAEPGVLWVWEGVGKLSVPSVHCTIGAISGNLHLPTHYVGELQNWPLQAMTQHCGFRQRLHPVLRGQKGKGSWG